MTTPELISAISNGIALGILSLACGRLDRTARGISMILGRLEASPVVLGFKGRSRPVPSSDLRRGSRPATKRRKRK